MRTEEILNLDCKKEENVRKINRFLWNVKPVARILEKNDYTKTEQAPIELLEEALHGIFIRYGYKHQGISTYYEEGRFVFYNVSIVKRDSEEKTVVWKGNVYGKTLWETIAKMIVKVYADILSERKKNNER